MKLIFVVILCGLNNCFGYLYVEIINMLEKVGVIILWIDV